MRLRLLYTRAVFFFFSIAVEGHDDLFKLVGSTYASKLLPSSSHRHMFDSYFETRLIDSARFVPLFVRIVRTCVCVGDETVSERTGIRQ